jgi:peroxiredoxin
MSPIDTLRSLLTIATCTLLTATHVALANTVEVGKPAPDFKGRDLAGKERTLAEFRGKPVVLEWNNPGCPFVRKHYNSGNMQSLQADYTHKGVVWLTVNSTNPQHPDYAPPAAQQNWNDQMHLAATAYLADTSGAVGSLYGARNTPQMFIVDTNGILAYAGAIDDKRSAAVEDVKTAKNYVKQALDELLSGKPVSVANTTPYGCSVKY